MGNLETYTLSLLIERFASNPPATIDALVTPAIRAQGPEPSQEQKALAGKIFFTPESDLSALLSASSWESLILQCLLRPDSMAMKALANLSSADADAAKALENISRLGEQDKDLLKPALAPFFTQTPDKKTLDDLYLLFLGRPLNKNDDAQVLASMGTPAIVKKLLTSRECVEMLAAYGLSGDLHHENRTGSSPSEALSSFHGQFILPFEKDNSGTDQSTPSTWHDALYSVFQSDDFARFILARLDQADESQPVTDSTDWQPTTRLANRPLRSVIDLLFQQGGETGQKREQLKVLIVELNKSHEDDPVLAKLRDKIEQAQPGFLSFATLKLDNEKAAAVWTIFTGQTFTGTLADFEQPDNGAGETVSDYERLIKAISDSDGLWYTLQTATLEDHPLAMPDGIDLAATARTLASLYSLPDDMTAQLQTATDRKDVLSILFSNRIWTATFWDCLPGTAATRDLAKAVFRRAPSELERIRDIYSRLGGMTNGITIEIPDTADAGKFDIFRDLIEAQHSFLNLPVFSEQITQESVNRLLRIFLGRTINANDDIKQRIQAGGAALVRKLVGSAEFRKIVLRAAGGGHLPHITKPGPSITDCAIEFAHLFKIMGEKRDALVQCETWQAFFEDMFRLEQTGSLILGSGETCGQLVCDEDLATLCQRVFGDVPLPVTTLALFQPNGSVRACVRHEPGTNVAQNSRLSVNGSILGIEPQLQPTSSETITVVEFSNWRQDSRSARLTAPHFLIDQDNSESATLVRWLETGNEDADLPKILWLLENGEANRAMTMMLRLAFAEKPSPVLALVYFDHLRDAGDLEEACSYLQSVVQRDSTQTIDVIATCLAAGNLPDMLQANLLGTLNNASLDYPYIGTVLYRLGLDGSDVHEENSDTTRGQLCRSAVNSILDGAAGYSLDTLVPDEVSLDDHYTDVLNALIILQAPDEAVAGWLVQADQRDGNALDNVIDKLKKAGRTIALLGPAACLEPSLAARLRLARAVAKKFEEQKQHANAITYAMAAAEARNWADIGSLVQAAQLTRKFGDRRVALDLFEKVLKLDGKNLRLLETKLRIESDVIARNPLHRKDGFDRDLKRLLEARTKALMNRPGNVSVHEDLARTLLLAGRRQEAREIFANVVSSGKGSIDSQVQLINITYQMRDYEECCRLAEAIPEDQISEWAVVNHVRALRAMERIEEAGALLEKHYKPERASIARERVRNLFFAGDYDAARRMGEETSAQQPDDTELHLLCAAAHLEAGTLDMVRPHIEKAHEVAPPGSFMEELCLFDYAIAHKLKQDEVAEKLDPLFGAMGCVPVRFAEGSENTFDDFIVPDEETIAQAAEKSGNPDDPYPPLHKGPLVSVIMTSYNSEQYLDTAIRSIMEQNYRNIELIVVDDCSTDSTPQMLQDWEDRDPRVRAILKSENSGTYVSKNMGLLLARGTYIALQDSDDWSHPDRIGKSVSALEKRPDVMGLTTDWIRMTTNGEIQIKAGGQISHVCCISLVFRRELVLKAIGFFDSVRIEADMEYIRRISLTFGESSILRLRWPLLFGRARSDSLTGNEEFGISRTGFSAPRLEYQLHQANWHREIETGNTTAYMPFPLSERKFKAPGIILPVKEETE
uniref:Glycosyltransferase 2-like domain-containing protein n=1 Tax=Aquisalinus luteolus TaxID=1566827 RepID=A0A8J3ES24_9PROT|nr:hypothetical protein GCM10011355_32950 [Aquisalinus luteolus]